MPVQGTDVQALSVSDLLYQHGSIARTPQLLHQLHAASRAPRHGITGTARVGSLATAYKILWFVPKDFWAWSVDRVATHTPAWSALKGLQGPRRREKGHTRAKPEWNRHGNSGTNSVMIGRRKQETFSEMEVKWCLVKHLKVNFSLN